jgi:hypothetical protein
MSRNTVAQELQLPAAYKTNQAFATMLHYIGGSYYICSASLAWDILFRVMGI